uniref:NB-ARC domain-containing protein n=1 Tax=Lactuca sativa TaxID=4236 RepID=A0A9R1XWF1_LACSA|nr:hypothetical protein LSAT_V11C200052260 [Lactuca sativa]
MAIVDSVVDPTGIVGAIINPIAQTALVPLTDHVGYMISCRKYVRDMQMKMTELNTSRISAEEHISRNTRNHLQIPSQIKDWLDQVEGIRANVANFPIDVISCCSLRIRHKLGQKAFKITEQIESLTRQNSLIIWTDEPVPLGRVGSMIASTSAASSDHHDVFPSREQIFRKALEALEPVQKSHIIALWGMGGVGKTTMMKKLKEVVEQKKMFNIIVQVVIGEKTNPIAIQQAVADYLSIELKENTKEARADKLRKWFEDDGGKNKFLVILDDVWQFVDLEDIGLSPLPNKGVNFKVLLTSRDSHVCTLMGAEANSILNIKVLTAVEGQSLFRQFAKNAGDDDLDPAFNRIADSIASRCQGLPIAIKTIALSLKGRSKSAWDVALSRLENHKIGSEEVVREVFKISYDNLQDEVTKSIFLLCALFPEDFDIPTEELMRYGWGLKLFIEAKTISEARNRLNTCTERLRETNLLFGSDYFGCVKMHDVVRDFVLHMFSEVEHASIVNHGNMSEWPEKNDTSNSCKRISLTCKGMSKFPKDLNYPNLSILKLMHGDKSLSFPEDFYGKMEKVQVISYDKLMYPLLPSSLECSTNVRVLHLHYCSLRMFDCSSIGNLLNMEVLSFANSNIEWLPSTIGNLKKLRLLDLTNCKGLRIDNGVLKNLVKLEELYMGVNRLYGQAVSLTDENCNEMAERSKNLLALESKLFKYNAQVKNISFENLERFKISVGRSLDGSFSKSRHSYENTLKLAIDKGELLESRMNGLFEKTEVLCLSVGDMYHLSDVKVKSSSFYNLRVLVVSECAELKHLFTLGVANTLSKLEHLEVYKCDNMEELIHTGGSEGDTITFPKLKLLYLHGLPNLLGLCLNVNAIELPELVQMKLYSIPGFTSIYPRNKLEASSLLKEEVVIPKLDILEIHDMENLKEIWPSELSRGEKVKLREIKVRNCDKLVNLFPHNPMSLLHHLEELIVEKCGSIEELFNIDLDCASVIGEEDNNSSLRNINVENSMKLREVWRIKGADNSRPLFRGFQVVEKIIITRCKRFTNVFTPITTNFDLGALLEISVDCRGNDESDQSNQEQEQTDILSEEETLQEATASISNVVFPPCLMHSFHNLHKLKLDNYEGVEVVFEIESESPTCRELVTTHNNQQQPIILPYLQELYLRNMDNTSHVWKCSNWNNFFTLPKQQSESPFHNLTTINIEFCRSIKYLFSPLMVELLSNLKKLHIERCDGIEEVVSNRDDEDEEMTTSTHTTTNLFPHLNSLTLRFMRNLNSIGGGGAKDEGSNEISFNNTTTTTAVLDQFELSEAGGVSWSLCQYSREIIIYECHALSSVIPCYAAGQMQKLQVLTVMYCDGLKEVFETQLGTSSNKNRKSGGDEGNGGVPRVNNNVIMLPNLKILRIENCDGLEHIFTFSALESLRQLQELKIEDCYRMKVIVKKEEDEYGEQQTTTTTTKGASSSSSSSSSSKKVVVFPCLKSIVLVNLPELVGFFLGKNEFQMPSLDKLIITECPKMMVFAAGGSTAPQLKYIHTELGRHALDQESGLNFHQTSFQSLYGDTLGPATSEGTTWSFHNLIELYMEFNDDVKKIIPSSELLQLQKLEKIHVSWCDGVEEVFETALEAAGRNGNSGIGFDESSQTTTTTLVNLPNLGEMKLRGLDCLRYIWKSNQWTAFEFPNLTRVEISVCNRLEHVFTSSMVGSLLQLQELRIWNCSQIEVVIVQDADVSVEEDKEKESDGKTNKEILALPHLKSLKLQLLQSLKGFSLGTAFEFPKLTRVEISNCNSLEHVFTSSMVGSLSQLQELHIDYCRQMEEVIVKDADVCVEEDKEKESDGKTNKEILVLPRLKSLTLEWLPCLKGFSLGKEDFSFPLLDTLSISRCPAITTFTKGNSTTPQLKEIETNFGSFYAAGEKDINSLIKIKQQFVG